MPPYHVLTVANTFLELAWSWGQHVTPDRLQRLVYIAHGWYLALTGGHPLITGRVDGSPRGIPIIGELHEAMGAYGTQPIDEPFGRKSDEGFTDKYREAGIDTVPLEDRQVHQLLHTIWHEYVAYTDEELVAMTTTQASPVYRLWLKPPRGASRSEIPVDLIQRHFEVLLKRYRPY